GIVARDLAGREIPLHQHLERLAVPYSCEGGAGLAGPASRRASALAALLAAGPDAATGAWFAATGDGGPRALDVRLAARIAGLTTLGAFAALDVAALVGDGQGIVLPVARAVEAVDDEGNVGPSSRRFVTSGAIERVVRGANSWLDAWRALPARGPAQALLGAVRRLAMAALPPGEAAGRRDAEEVLDDLVADAEGTIELERDEALAAAAEALRHAGRTPAGGSGAGVQVLGVVEARGRTFDHLFLVGLNRDVFPRVVREDPLLPDRLRQALAELLPDLPLKRTGFDEERYLFAQALGAARHATLSWLECDDDGRETPPSPLVERLLLARSEEPDPVADQYSRERAETAASPRPAHEHLVLAGLYSGRRRFGDVLPAALAAAGVKNAETVGLARRAVLDEHDPDRRTESGRARDLTLGPYFGFVGASSGPRPGPGGGDVAVTTLQDVAACPWQTFLRRLLRLEAPPEPGAALPAADRGLIGSTVHRVLEVLVGRGQKAGAGEVAEVLGRATRAIEWPDPDDLEVLILEAASDVLHSEGVRLPGLARALAAGARALVEVARSIDLDAEAGGVLGAEVVGRATVADGTGGHRPIAFRADRAEVRGGRLRLVDFKTGAPRSGARAEKGKRDATVGRVASGEWLQAPAYTRASGSVPVDGVYLFLAPGLEDVQRAWAIEAGDAEIGVVFDAATATLLSAWDAGAFVPRLADSSGRKEPTRCAWCPVRPACLAGDSGARRRLVGWAAAAEPGRLGEAERAALGVWGIGRATREGES
ncbi:MAG: PD-(D/E)XK nuclease family protein, partial [Acidobacteriota bacterium]